MVSAVRDRFLAGLPAEHVGVAQEELPEGAKTLDEQEEAGAQAPASASITLEQTGSSGQVICFPTYATGREPFRHLLAAASVRYQSVCRARARMSPYRDA